jgi:hypothetical protein
MGKSTLCAVGAALLLGASSVSAHHEFAKDFDRDKPVMLSGAVTKVQWTNPHVYAFIDVKDQQGKATNWKVEMGSPDELTKAGWARNSLKVGEMVMMHGWQAKNGTHFANAEEMTLANGTKMSAASSYDRDAAVPTSGSRTPQPTGSEKAKPY